MPPSVCTSPFASNVTRQDINHYFTASIVVVELQLTFLSVRGWLYVEIELLPSCHQGSFAPQLSQTSLFRACPAACPVLKGCEIGYLFVVSSLYVLDVQ